MIFITDLNPNEEVIGKRRSLPVRSWSTVSDVKNLIFERLHVPVANQRLFYRDKELKNTRSLQDVGVCRSGETLKWSIVSSQSGSSGSSIGSSGSGDNPMLKSYGDDHLKCPRSLKHLLLQSKRALLLGFVPSLSLDGTGGCYFLSNPLGQKITVFKPRDEEPFMENNPREGNGNGGGGFSFNINNNNNNNTNNFSSNDSPIQMRKNVPAGTSCYREVAAYRLDIDHHAGIPQTTLVYCSHSKLCYYNRKIIPKLGSLQEFSSNIGNCEDVSFTKFPISEVHRVAILDIRILNCDRNCGNLLMKEENHNHNNYELSNSNSNLNSNSNSKSEPPRISLVPIDHGYCFPDSLEISWCDWCWLDWPQCKEPLSKEMLYYIDKVINPMEDGELISNKLLVGSINKNKTHSHHTTIRKQNTKKENNEEEEFHIDNKDEEDEENVMNKKSGYLIRLSGLLLQYGCRNGLSLYEIATLIVRQDLDGEEPSQLEILYEKALLTFNDQMMDDETNETNSNNDNDKLQNDKLQNEKGFHFQSSISYASPISPSSSSSSSMDEDEDNNNNDNVSKENNIKTKDDPQQNDKFWDYIETLLDELCKQDCQKAGEGM
mmetsp:Transcript_35933/g.46330  ORF Transcript_35933/g.46330 Transcript_35933/m.46330 type:complete len:603 (+) Transcript_35933:248-2056(+)